MPHIGLSRHYRFASRSPTAPAWCTSIGNLLSTCEDNCCPRLGFFCSEYHLAVSIFYPLRVQFYLTTSQCDRTLFCPVFPLTPLFQKSRLEGRAASPRSATPPKPIWHKGGTPFQMLFSAPARGPLRVSFSMSLRRLSSRSNTSASVLETQVLR